jgi:Flp pilus assembly protein TadB
MMKPEEYEQIYGERVEQARAEKARLEERRQHMIELAEATKTGRADLADLSERWRSVFDADVEEACAQRRRATKDTRAAEAMAALRPGARGNMIPFRIKVIALLGVFLGFLLADEVRDWDSLSAILMAVAFAVPGPLLRRAAESYNRQRTAEQTKTRKQIEAGRSLAVKEGLWWPEADGSISIGGKPIQVDEADQ